MRIRIPPILLEGDAPQTASPLKRIPASEPIVGASVEPVRTTGTLPETYGTQQLKLTPRDPHWILAHWDFSRPQLQAAAARSSEGGLVLRLFQHSTRGSLMSETPVPAESSRWMVHAPQPGAPYVAEIGYYDADRQWSVLAAAEPVRTPPAGPCADLGFEMATLTPEGALLRQETRGLPWAAVQMPAGAGLPGELGQPSVALGGIGISSLGGPAESAPTSIGVTSWGPSIEAWSSAGSPAGGVPQRPFRLEVNAELIVYGATEPDAMLRIGDRFLPLEADGTFRLRFSLPDGTHPLTLKATAAGTGEQRVVELCFVRRTDISGQVDSAPIAGGLKPPAAENL